MFKLFLNTTDNFLCNNLKTIFEKAEKKYQDSSVDLFKELEKLELNALVSREHDSSNFEKNVKLKLKIVLGIFFVAIPLFAFVSFTYLFHGQYSYAFIFTFAIALFATMRMEKIIHRYAQKRCSKLRCS
jgi:hypothetical protein